MVVRNSKNKNKHDILASAQYKNSQPNFSQHFLLFLFSCFHTKYTQSYMTESAPVYFCEKKNGSGKKDCAV